jgi:hypothetical protein
MSFAFAFAATNFWSGFCLKFYMMRIEFFMALLLVLALLLWNKRRQIRKDWESLAKANA